MKRRFRIQNLTMRTGAFEIEVEADPGDTIDDIFVGATPATTRVEEMALDHIEDIDWGFDSVVELTADLS